MGVKKDFGAAAYAAKAIAAFKDAATTPYQTAYVQLGKGAHTFGNTEFRTMKELAAEIESIVKQQKLSPESFVGRIDATCALFSFTGKEAYYNFMNATHDRNTSKHNLIVQVAGKPREWHHKAGEYLAFENRILAQQAPDSSRAIHANVPLFAGQLVDYIFPNLEMMKNFCERVSSGRFDEEAAALQAATQPHLRSSRPA